MITGRRLDFVQTYGYGILFGSAPQPGHTLGATRCVERIRRFTELRMIAPGEIEAQISMQAHSRCTASRKQHGNLTTCRISILICSHVDGTG
jgi:hypothetical protein